VERSRRIAARHESGRFAPEGHSFLEPNPRGHDQFKKSQMLRRAFLRLLKQLPENLLNDPDTQLLAQEADEHVFNIIQMIYRAKSYEGTSKDYEFSAGQWRSTGKPVTLTACATLHHPEVLQRPDNPAGIRTFDLARDGRHKDATT